MAPLHRLSSTQFELLPLVISTVACAGLCLSIILCAKCCKKRRSKKEVILKLQPLVVGGVGERYEQVTMSFAVNVLRVVTAPTVKGARAPSCVFSPYALQASFGVCLLGAHATTQIEMTNTLFPNSGSITYAEDVLKGMIESTMASRRQNFFRVFLRVYTHSAFPYSSEYKRTIETDFKSTPFVTIDYRKSNSEIMARTTHQWLTNATRGQLTQFTSTSWWPVDEKKSSLCVVSAATLACPWTQPFYRHHTRSDKPFFIRVGESVKVDMMRQTQTFGYYENEQLQVIRLEYRSPGMALYIFLPRIISGLEMLEKKTTPDFILATCKAAAQRQHLLDVSLPKFKMECEIGDPLVIALANLGLATSFKKGEADFSHIIDHSVASRKTKLPSADQRLWISGAVHKVLVEFTDEPAQAQSPGGKSGHSLKSVSVSRGTASSSAGSGSMRGGVQTFVADHPFIFLIVIEPKMTPLFFGRFCGL